MITYFARQFLEGGGRLRWLRRCAPCGRG